MQGMGVVFSFRQSLITFELIWKKIHNIFDSGIDIDHVFFLYSRCLYCEDVVFEASKGKYEKERTVIIKPSY